MLQFRGDFGISVSIITEFANKIKGVVRYCEIFLINMCKKTMI